MGGMGRNRRYCPVGLILAPTRELATQIHAESLKLTYCTSIHCVVVYGGMDIRQQFRELDRGCDVVVGTPGRLMDFVERGRISLAQISYLCLDEVSTHASHTNSRTLLFLLLSLLSFPQHSLAPAFHHRVMSVFKACEIQTPPRPLLLCLFLSLFSHLLLSPLPSTLHCISITADSSPTSFLLLSLPLLFPSVARPTACWTWASSPRFATSFWART